MVGGYAVVAHGYHRTTGDLDVWVNPTEENYLRMSKAFSVFGLPIDSVEKRAFLDPEDNDVFRFGRTPMAIDILTKVKGLEFDSCFESADKLKIGGIVFSLLSLKDLKTAKRAAGRNKDLDDLENL